ncbi:MAG: hypothetical protein JWP88_218 [Flaviaesturariibacter sp.]|nr:hypothetical protein [Flaviaesturariibacter sp.]
MVKSLRFYNVVFSAIFLSLSSCIGPKKINKWVDHHYGALSISKSKNDYLTISSPLVTAGQPLSTTTKKTKNVIPLLFYWRYDYVNTCNLNPQLPVNAFSATVLPYANSKGLKQKLGGRKLELSIEQLPAMFVLNDRAHLIWVVYAFGWDNITIRPDEKNLVVSYKLTGENREGKSGKISVQNSTSVMQLHYLQSVKKATAEYLDVYDETIKAMSKKVIDQLLTEI